MLSVRVRRAAALALALALIVAGVSLADTVVADGDSVTAGDQAVTHLGAVAPGAAVPVDVAFRLTCKGSSHVAGGTTITVGVVDQTWPEDGTATATAGSIGVPGDWPAPGTACPDSGLPTTVGATPVHLALTAPTVVGSGFEFTFLFEAVPGTGVGNTIAFSATLDVVEPDPVDEVAPTLVGVPADMTVFTSGVEAIVTWPSPTATDDTDPDPVVACEPASGSSFGPGTTAVTCTAADAAGNRASATFDVTVRRLSAAWGRPLDDGAVPALVGEPGRTIPLRLAVTAGDAVQGPAEIDAPVLTLERLASAGADAAVVETRAVGAFDWVAGAWSLNVRTDGLTPGSWRLTATVDGAPLAAAIVLLAPDAAAKQAIRSRVAR